jgi:hypothetical protein
VQAFIELHLALILRHARAVVRAHADKIAPEDVSREMELELEQLARQQGLTEAQIESPDHFLRAIARHAFGRAKRRRTLIEQLAAGDDLDALSNDLAQLDADLPTVPSRPSAEGATARTTLEKLKDALSPFDALVAALLFEDEGTIEDVAEWLTMPADELNFARERILIQAHMLGIEPLPAGDDRRGGP